MLAHFLDLLGLSVRMLHFVSGVAWIGASFYFNWLENALERAQQREEIAGSLWAVHGGGFYYVEKYKIAPGKIPETLHWFKWEAYTTWLSGMVLLTLVYYFNAGVFLANPTYPSFAPTTLIAIGVGTLVGGWLVYDQLCKSRLGIHSQAIAAVGLVGTMAVAFGLSHVMNPRGMFMHVGAMLGTCMVANVFFVIIPSQKNLVQAARKGLPPDAAMGKRALLRSRHNNYLTLPVLFVMVSSHYPFTFSHPQSWLILTGFGLCGGLIRHWFNLKAKGDNQWWPLANAFLLLVAVGLATLPKRIASMDERPVAFSEAQGIIKKHCISCHSIAPQDDIFKIAPAGVTLDSPEQMQALAPLIRDRTVTSESMPFGNKTGMTKEERVLLGMWIVQGAKISP